jgi:hypothetical protein
VIIRNSSAAMILAREVPTVKIIKEQNDFGILQKKNSVQFDVIATRRAVTQWMRGWRKDVPRLRQIIRENSIDIVLADIAPQPHVAAKEEGIPAVFIGSFTWLDAYKHLKVVTHEQEKQLRAAYNCASIGIITPFSGKCDGIRKMSKVGLIAQRPKGRVKKIPRSILYSLSGSMQEFSWHAPDFTGTLIMSSFLQGTPVKKITRIKEGIAAVEYINAADAIITKSGYGIVAEAIVSRKPLFIICRYGFQDDEIIVKTLTRWGIAQEISAEEVPRIVTNEIFAKAKLLQKNYKRLPVLYRQDGTREAVKIIEGMI